MIKQLCIVSLSILCNSGCSATQPVPIPLGDDLDYLLIVGAGDRIYGDAVSDCLAAQALDPSPWQALFDRAAHDGSGVEPPSAPPDQESGIVRSELAQLSAAETSDSASLSPPVISALTERVYVAQRSYEGGCTEYARDVQSASPAELARRELLVEYDVEVNSALSGDPRWLAASQMWSECMAAHGYRGLSAPGDQLVQIQNAVTAASGDVSQLEDIRLEDQRVTTASIRCYNSTSVRDVRLTLKAEYQERFVVRYDSQLEHLVSLVDAAVVRSPDIQG